MSDIKLKKYSLSIFLLMISIIPIIIIPNYRTKTRINESISIDALKASSLTIQGDLELSIEADKGSGTKSDPYIIENRTIDGGGSGILLGLWNITKYVIIRNCTTYNGWVGIYLDNVTNAVITNCTVYDHSQAGIQLSDNAVNNTINETRAYDNAFFGIFLTLRSERNNISFNDVFDNPAYAIGVYNSDENRIFNNTLKYNRDGLYLISSNNSLIENNSIWYYNIATIQDNCAGNTIQNNNLKDLSAILSIMSDNDLAANADSGSGTLNDPFIIEKRKIDAGGTGYCIRIFFTSKHLILRDCECTNAGGAGGTGINFLEVSNITLTQNILYGNSYAGLSFQDSIKNTVYDNTIRNNYDNGLYLNNGSFINVSYNNIYENEDDGIFLYESHNNIIKDNTINDNKDYGILLFDSTQNNITWNTLHGNDGCIGMDFSSNGNNLVENNDCQNQSDKNDDDDDDDDEEITIPGYNSLIIAICIILMIASVWMLNKQLKHRIV